MILEEALIQHEDKIKHIALRFKRKCPAAIEMDDLMQEGRMALWAAFKNYDPNRGAQLWTYAEYKVKGAMQDYINKQALYNNRKTGEIVFTVPMSEEMLQSFVDPDTDDDNEISSAFIRVLAMKEAFSHFSKRQKRIFVDIFIYQHTSKEIMKKYRISFNKYKEEFGYVVNAIKGVMEN
jgi:RNA polymerase sigma factor (sigma-70 family)